ncbi:MAG: fibronectin type III domain-containing protein [Planctomycetaceae bacterium]|nr:fibronectin type III domain-containing protein [Planctomycetaceae bacterium]
MAATGSDTISVAWNAITNASGYVVQYATNSAFTAGVGTVTATASATTAVIDKLTANTTYYVRVMATGIGTYSDSDYSVSKSATTLKIKLTTPTLGAVTATGSDTINVAWNAIANASGYVVQYAMNSAFTAGVGTVTVSSQSTTTAVIDKLTANTVYYVRVMATSLKDIDLSRGCLSGIWLKNKVNF